MQRLIIGDLHAPFELKNYLRFLKRLKKRYECTEVISIGDIIDLHTVSRFLTSPEAESSVREWRMAKETLKRYHGELGLSKVVIGNHDIRPVKRAREAHLPNEWMKPIDEVYSLNGVEFKEEFFLDDVLYIHDSLGGANGWQNACKASGCSTVCGHYHAVGGIRYHQMRDGKTMFSMCVGCGVDKDAYAFEYAKGNPNLPIIGAGVTIHSSLAYFEPFDWTDRRNLRRD